MREQLTLVILKPDCVQKRVCGQVINRLENLQLDICAMEMHVLDEAVVKEHYAHLEGQPFYDRLITFMTSGPSVVLALRGEDAIAAVRQALGPTNCAKAPAGTIRGDLGERTDPARTSMYNIAHGSDSPAAAAVELERFFPNLHLGQ